MIRFSPACSRPHPAERGFGDRLAFGGASIAAASCCQFLFSSSKSSATDRKIALTDQAKLAAEKSTFTESGGVTLGSKAKVVTGVDLSGAKAGGDVKVVAGADFGGNLGTINIQEANPELLGNLLDQITASSAAQTATLASALQAAGQGQAAGQDQGALAATIQAAVQGQGADKSLVSSLVEKITGLAESKQTDGASTVNRYLLWIVLAALVLAGVYLFRRRKG